MNERLLQYIWQFQLFNKAELSTIAGENISIQNPGQINHNQGPDFLNARLRINETTWAGNVELHILTSDWDKHGHHGDANYDNVILHVVWEHDSEAGPKIPILALAGKVPRILLQRYEELMRGLNFIPCENLLSTVPELTWKHWVDRLITERLERKASHALESLKQTQFHWEETFWILLAKNFGLRVNTESFEAMARSIPLSILSRHKHQVQQIEALLFGQIGLLENKLADHYPKLLQREYQFLRKKYKLRPIHLPVFFLRMRPGNFPSIRLAQLSMLIHNSVHLFSRVKECDSITELQSWFDVVANDYWHYHYRFDEASSFKIKKLGSSMTWNIIINTIVPLLFAYGQYNDQQKYKNKALEWLEKVPGENNSIINQFMQRNVSCRNAMESQALLELKNEYCDKRRCLECAVGHAILKTKNEHPPMIPR